MNRECFTSLIIFSTLQMDTRSSTGEQANQPVRPVDSTVLRTIMKKILPLLILLLISVIACQQEAELSREAINPAELPTNISVETTAAVQNHEDVILIDVREQWEYDEAHIPGVTLIPLSELESRVAEIPTDKEVILTCRSGNRSGQALGYLEGLGYDNLHNMEGGILAWQAAGLAVE